MKNKVLKIALTILIALFISSFLPKAEAYYAFGPYYPIIDPLYFYNPFAYSTYAAAPTVPYGYRSADALLTTLALLGILPTTTTTTTLLPTTTTTIGITTALLGGVSTSTLLLSSLLTPTTTTIPTTTYPTYTYPTTTSTLGLTTLLLLGGTSSTTLLALGI